MNIRDHIKYKRGRKGTSEQRFHRICLAAALVIASGITLWAAVQRGMLVEARTQAATEELARQVLRFHVLADSDDAKDQEVKMKVKEAVLFYLQEQMEGKSELDATKQFVREHLEEIAGVAEQTLEKEGSKDPVKVELTEDEFPEKTYGDVTFPEGTYEALRISIGRGEGHNWWCCLYPSLCFTDAVSGKVVSEDKQELKGLLDEDAYEMITCTTDFKIKWFFFDNR